MNDATVLELARLVVSGWIVTVIVVSVATLTAFVIRGPR